MRRYENSLTNQETRRRLGQIESGLKILLRSCFVQAFYSSSPANRHIERFPQPLLVAHSAMMISVLTHLGCPRTRELTDTDALIPGDDGSTTQQKQTTDDQVDGADVIIKSASGFRFEDSEPNEDEDPEEALKVIPKTRRGKAWFFFCIASYWFAKAVCMSAMTSVVTPSQIASIVGQDEKYRYASVIPISGVLVSFFISPLSGALSDCTTSRFGRRRPYILSGSIVALVALSVAWISKTNVYILLVCLTGIQFGTNWGGGPYSGLIPDLVPKAYVGMASGCMALGGALGNLVGILGCGLLAKKTVIKPIEPSLTPYPSYLIIYIYLAVIFTIFNIPTLLGVKERPLPKSANVKFTLRKFFASFYLPRDQYFNFYWVCITRAFEQFGIYTVLPYFQYYLKDVIKVDEPEFKSSLMLGTIIATSIPSSIICGPLSDKFGRKPLVYLCSGLMAVCCSGFLVLCFRPSFAGVMATSAFFGIGYGGYLAVDWALASKDMGIWDQTQSIPQVLAPLISGQIIDAVKRSHNISTAFAIVFSMTITWFVLSSVMIFPIKLQPKSSEKVALEEVDFEKVK
eukprot:gene15236-18032_t